MAYSELVKDFSKVRSYLRQFYVYGFKSREEYTARSTRTYDNERRRIESWLGEYMQFRQGANGRNVYLSVDSRSISSNPLYKALKAKSFTDKDIMLHFYLLDILVDEVELTAAEIMARLCDDYLYQIKDCVEPDLSTIRKKLKEYEELGLLVSSKKGNKLYYSRCKDEVSLLDWQEAISYFAEVAPVGILGSSLVTQAADEESSLFKYKHNYILQALDSEVMADILVALGEQRRLKLQNENNRTHKVHEHEVVPLQIFSSTQTGKEYLLCYHLQFHRVWPFRLDSITITEIGEVEADFAQYRQELEQIKDHLWGVSFGDRRAEEKLDTVRLVLYILPGEEYIINRLEREKRCGSVTKIDDNRYQFTAEVFDAGELLPWARTFIGRIESFSSSNKRVEELFYQDLAAMEELYGEEK